jgi:uncharacterized protein YukE
LFPEIDYNALTVAYRFRFMEVRDSTGFSQRGAGMSQAIVNPEELRRFAQMLKKFNTGLAEQMTALSGQLDALATSWRDQENHRFSEEFQRNLQTVGRFIQSNDEYIPFLLRKAERIDEYLQQR